ncbi:MAG: hypothetical protein IT227_09685 [Flavobacteriales bacterium]|nr:hypothetical protein [Flavobacteriales bacterium]
MRAGWIILFGLAVPARAQFWEPLGRGSLAWGNSAIVSLYGDTVLDRLLAGGNFVYMVNTVDTALCIGQAQWNGERWDSLAHRIQFWDGELSGAQPTYWFMRYRGDLYASGAFSLYDQELGEFSRGAARLVPEEQRWEVLECLNFSSTGMAALGWRDPQDTLYATGTTGSLCGYPESCAFAYDGQGFQPWPPWDEIPEDPNNYVGIIFKFRGCTYMSGTFLDPVAGTDWVSFIRYCGNGWEHVPGGEGIWGLKDVVIQGDTLLYVAGSFHTSEGAPGNLVVAFDGENWNDLGGGLAYAPSPGSGWVTDLLLWHGELYAAGMFTHAGGATAPKIAKWNGQQWCGLPGDHLTGGPKLNEMAVWRDSLYVCGDFEFADGVPANKIAKWIGGDAVSACSDPTGVGEASVEDTRMRVWPDGAGNWSIELPTTRSGPWQMTLTNVLGQVVRTALLANGKGRMSAVDLATGPYVLTAVNGTRLRYVTKVVRP